MVQCFVVNKKGSVLPVKAQERDKKDLTPRDPFTI
jgi:hypothetical protein